MARRLAGYLFDLPRSALLGTFTAGEDLATNQVLVRSGTHVPDAIFEQVQHGAGAGLAEKLVTLTGGDADAAMPPPG